MRISRANCPYVLLEIQEFCNEGAWVGYFDAVKLFSGEKTYEILRVALFSSLFESLEDFFFFLQALLCSSHLSQMTPWDSDRDTFGWLVSPGVAYY